MRILSNTEEAIHLKDEDLISLQSLSGTSLPPKTQKPFLLKRKRGGTLQAYLVLLCFVLLHFTDVAFYFTN